MHHEQDARGNTFLGLVAVVLRRWRMVAVIAVATILGGVASSVLGPASYVTSTTMVPFAGSQSRSGVALANLPPGVAGLVGGSTSSPTDRLVGVVLNSHTLADSMVGRLAPRFATEAEVRETLAQRTRVLRSTEGAVTIQVRSADADLARRMANTFPALVNDAMARLTSEGAVRRQALIESQMAVARERLVLSEQRLLSFQRTRSVPNVDEQATRTLDAAADLHQRVLEQELRVAELRRSLAPGHPQRQSAEAGLATLRGQLRRVAQGSGPAFVPLGEGGELKLATARLEREFLQDQQLYQSLTGALAEAQLDAHNNLPVLTVLDSARVPVRAGSPVRAAQMAAVFGVLLGIALALAGEALRRARGNPDNAGFFAAWGQFRRDLRLGRRRRGELAHGD